MTMAPRDLPPTLDGSWLPNLRVVLLTVAALLVGIVAAYWPLFSNGFIAARDHEYLLNPIVSQGLSLDGIRRAFTETHAGFWHPITLMSHMIDVELFGMAAAWHHGMSLALHAFNAVLVLIVLNRLTGAWWRSAAVAAIFALHPLRVESVAWVAERKDVLCALFGLCALWAYAIYATAPSARRYIMVAVFALLSLMSNPMLVTLPILLLVLDYWPLERLKRMGIGRAVIEKLPLLAIAIAVGTIALLAQGASGSADHLHLTIGQRLSNAVVSYARYLGNSLWPVDLAFFYPYPQSWPAWTVGGSAALLVALTGLSLWVARWHPYIAAGWLWFLGTLVPVIGLVPVGAQSMADRYTYFPHIGLAMMAVWGVAAMVPARQGLRRTAYARVGLAAAVVAVAVLLGARSHVQARVWRDSETLYRHTIAATAENAEIRNELGKLMAAEGRDAEALELFAEAARMSPQHAEIQANLGEALIKTEDIDGAMAAFERAVAAGPDDAATLNNLAWLLATHPSKSKRDGRRAVELAQRSCALLGRDDPSHLDTLAAAYAEVGNFKAAINLARRARALAIDADQDALAAIIDAHVRSFEDARPIRIEWSRP